MVKDSCNWDDVTTMSNVERFLSGNASTWFKSLVGGNVDEASNWNDFKRTFLSIYGNGTSSMIQTVDFTVLKQSEDEKVLEFYTRVVKVITIVLRAANNNLSYD